MRGAELLSFEHAGTRFVDPAHRFKSRSDFQQCLNPAGILLLMLKAFLSSRQSAQHQQPCRRPHARRLLPVRAVGQINFVEQFCSGTFQNNPIQVPETRFPSVSKLRLLSSALPPPPSLRAHRAPHTSGQRQTPARQPRRGMQMNAL